jgi:hypothetical protein
MKTFALSLAALITFTSSSAFGATLDDFSGTTASDSGNYNTVLNYEASSGLSAAPFTINGSGQLQPGGVNGTTTSYFRNTGETFALGDTVSIDIVSVSGTSNLAGLAFATSLNGTDNYVFDGLIGNSSNAGDPATSGGIDLNSTGPATFTLDFADGPVTESATRTATGFDYTFSGAGLTVVTPGADAGDHSFSGSFTDTAFDNNAKVYFGINIYGGDSAGSQIVDNLDYTVPEPSTYALLLLGGVGLLVLVRRNRALFNR